MKSYLAISMLSLGVMSGAALADVRYAKPVDDTPVYDGASYDHVNLAHYRLNLDAGDQTVGLTGWGGALQKRINAQWFVKAEFVDVETSNDSGLDRTLLGIGHIIPFQEGVTFDVSVEMGRLRVEGEPIDVIVVSAGMRQRIERFDWWITPRYTDYDVPSWVSISEVSVDVGADYFMDEHFSIGAKATLSGDYKLFGLGASYHF